MSGSYNIFTALLTCKDISSFLTSFEIIKTEDSSLIEQVESEIQAVISGVKPPEEATTAVAGKNSSKIDKVDQSGSDVYSKSNAVLNMTYPVPGHHGVSAGFPNYSSGKFHGGIDFPC